MSQTRSGDDAPANWPRSQPPPRTESLKYVVEEREGQPDYCTLSPREADEEPNLTEWISAPETAFVDAREMP